MQTRWLVVGLILALGATRGEAAKMKDCKLACTAQIAACATACDPFGTLDGACKKAVLQRCKKIGVETCAVATTSTTLITSTTVGGSTTTSTTLPASLCDTFCATVQANCTGGNQQYSDSVDCHQKCATFSTAGQDGDATGNTVQCRIYHAQLSAGSPVTHCPHTRPVSTPCQ